MKIATHYCVYDGRGWFISASQEVVTGILRGQGTCALVVAPALSEKYARGEASPSDVIISTIKNAKGAIR